MKIIVIGAGITGLSIGKLLSKKHVVKIFERDDKIGGIAKTKSVDGITYHMIGGHCFNSKYNDVLSWVFSFMDKSKWHIVNRVSKINLGGFEVDYPIEFSIRQIYEKDRRLAFQITKDFLLSFDDGIYLNLEDWFRKKFGNKLCDLYFLPYNSKIWGVPLSDMSHLWVEDKLPIPDKVSFFDGLMSTAKDKMPHSQFYYPNSNDQQTFINALAETLDVECNLAVQKIEKIGGKWVINDRYEADIIISTMPLNILPTLIQKTPENILVAASKLKYNKISNMLWKSKPTDKTWTYYPSKDNIFHRYIHIGNFFNPISNYTITESLGERTYQEMYEQGKMDSFLIEPIDYNVSDHAYVVFDQNRNECVISILDYLDAIGIYSIGRFGRWDYYNMDICIKQSIETYKKIEGL